MLKQTIIDVMNKVFRRVGFEVRRVAPIPFGIRLPDEPQWIRDVIQRVAPYTMTSNRRVAALCNAVEYVVRCEIPGDIVEGGVGRGGSMMAAALSLIYCGDTSRRLHLYDTFAGMTAPTEMDERIETGETASMLLEKSAKDHI